MVGTLLNVLGKVVLSMGMKLVAEEALEDLIIWAMEKLAASTKTKVDDELAAIVKKHLKDEVK